MTEGRLAFQVPKGMLQTHFIFLCGDCKEVYEFQVPKGMLQTSEECENEFVGFEFQVPKGMLQTFRES